MPSFKKLDIDIGTLDIAKIKGSIVEWKDDVFTQYNILNYKYFKSAFIDKFKFKILPTQYHYVEMIYPGVAPHCDPWPVVLNYFIESCIRDVDITSIFKNNIQIEHVVHIDPRGTSNYNPTGYDSNNLIHVESYAPNAGDVYLLNTHKIHSVPISNPETIRKQIRLAWSIETGVTFDNFSDNFL